MNTHFALLLFMPLTLKPPGLAEQQLTETSLTTLAAWRFVPLSHFPVCV